MLPQKLLLCELLYVHVGRTLAERCAAQAGRMDARSEGCEQEHNTCELILQKVDHGNRGSKRALVYEASARSYSDDEQSGACLGGLALEQALRYVESLARIVPLR